MNKHDDMVDAIRRSPHRIGIENQVATTGEVIFWKGQNYATSPDSLVFTPSKRILVVEYKAHSRNRRNDLKQLERHMEYTEDLFKGFEITGLYIHGRSIKKLEVEER